MIVISKINDRMKTKFVPNPRHIAIAKMEAEMSIESSVKVGAAITVSYENVIASGHAGLINQVKFTDDMVNYNTLRELCLIHAEARAMDQAQAMAMQGRQYFNAIYIHGIPPCIECTKRIVELGISNVVITQDPSTIDHTYAIRWESGPKKIFELAGYEIKEE